MILQGEQQLDHHELSPCSDCHGCLPDSYCNALYNCGFCYTLTIEQEQQPQPQPPQKHHHEDQELTTLMTTMEMTSTATATATAMGIASKMQTQFASCSWHNCLSSWPMWCCKAQVARPWQAVFVKSLFCSNPSIHTCWGSKHLGKWEENKEKALVHICGCFHPLGKIRGVQHLFITYKQTSKQCRKNVHHTYKLYS